MSFSIPSQIEKDLINGKALYRTHQVGIGGQSVLDVQDNAYIVIFGYDFSPAGGGLVQSEPAVPVGGQVIAPDNISFFGTQQLSFYTGNDFYPFVHNVPLVHKTVILDGAPVCCWEVVNAPISRPAYITSTKSVALTVGLVNKTNNNSTGAIPITNFTPRYLTFGGSGQTQTTQADLDNLGVNQFIQPNLENADIFGVTPTANAQNQLWWGPNTTYGLYDPSDFLKTVWGGVEAIQLAAANYKLNVHYALYQHTVPEARG